MEGRGFSNPVDVAIRSDGRMYVLSRTNPLQTYGIRVGICDLQSEYYGHFGSYGSGDGQFVWPTALAFDRDDNLYVADEHNHRISVFDGSGRFLFRWGTHGSGDGELHAPSGLAFDADDDLYVGDSRNNRVQKFTKEGAWLLSWGAEGGGAGEFNLPWAVGLDSQGHVYVADWRNDRIQKFPSGRGPLWRRLGSLDTMTDSFIARPALPWTGLGTCTSPTGETSGCRFWARMAGSCRGCVGRRRYPFGRGSSTRRTGTRRRPERPPS